MGPVCCLLLDEEDSGDGLMERERGKVRDDR